MAGLQVITFDRPFKAHRAFITRRRQARPRRVSAARCGELARGAGSGWLHVGQGQAGHAGQGVNQIVLEKGCLTTVEYLPIEACLTSSSSLAEGRGNP